MSITSSLPQTEQLSTDFSTFIEDFRERLRHVFRLRADADEVGITRGLEPFMMREVQRSSPLSVFIPEEYGGRGGHVHECQAVLAAASYESLALSLTIGINGALFLQPVSKYGREEVKQSIFERFIREKHMGGLMITEPDYGTDALNMQTSYEQSSEGGCYRLDGTKHWAGLTGWADFWLITARRRRPDGSLARDIDFFIADQDDPDQHITVEERFHNLGLYAIPYGRNRVDVTVPETHKLEPESIGIKMMLDTLHRSRTEFPGMGMGFLRRIMDEAMAHCKERFVGGQSLFQYDQVKKRLSRIQAYFTTCSAMCAYASDHAGTEHNLSTSTVSANSVKAVVTDIMHDAAQSFLQLTGAKGYRLDHLAGRATVDSRPFQIFEGSNDVLYEQISQAVLKKMKRAKEKNLYDYLSGYELTSRAAERFSDSLDFEVNYKMPQRKLVDLGRMIGRVVSMDLVIELGDRGFREDLISNSLKVLKQDAESFLSTYRSNGVAGIVEDYVEDSSWLSYAM
jgi:alkylation response protein AidB-like acyl-CoA dehydrogenase